MKFKVIPLLVSGLACAVVYAERTADTAPPFQPVRISETGNARSPAIAFNSTENQYLIVWHALDTSAGHTRVYGQRIAAATGREVGLNDFVISSLAAEAPAVAFNSALNEFLVVWKSSWFGYGQRGCRVAANGSLLGAEFTIGDATTSSSPSLAYNATAGEYLLAYPVFNFYDAINPCVECGPGEVTVQWMEIRRLNAEGVTLGVSNLDYDQRPGRVSFQFSVASVVWNSLDNEYLVVYAYDGRTRGARVGGNTGGSGGSFAVGAASSAWPGVTHNTTRNEYLVVWWQADGSGSGRVLGQRLTSTGAQIGTDDFAISRLSLYTGGSVVSYDAHRDEYLVVWCGTSPDGRWDMLGQRVSALGTEVGRDDFVMTSTGYDPGYPAVVYGAVPREHFIAWPGKAPVLALDEYEIFGYRYVPTTPFTVGLGNGGDGESQPWEIGPSGITQQVSARLPWPMYNTLNGEIHPAMGDLDGDGLSEIVVGLGASGDGWMAVFDDAEHNHALLTWIQLPWPSYNLSNGTIWPAVGDIDGDGKAEIVAGPWQWRSGLLRDL